MLGVSGARALKGRRRKPAQKNAKPPEMKTNPSKRHRDRLNVELDHLSGLLPFSEEVTGHLDKLSVLRLSVGYLKVKSYFSAMLQNRSVPFGSANDRNGPSVSLDGASFSEGQFLQRALDGFLLVVAADGTVFYASPTIQLFLGYHQSDVVHQSVYELVHVDDRDAFKCQLHFALDPTKTSPDITADDAPPSANAWSSSQSSAPQYVPPENSSFLERSFCCRCRCLLDNTSGFLALNFKGRLRSLSQGRAAPCQLALFAIATPVQPPSVTEIRTKSSFFQTKHRLDFAPLGIDGRGKLVLGYTETELLTPGSGYQFIHAADIMYCADTHLRTIRTGESGLAFFRLLTKARRWLWVQASARVVCKDGRPDFIIVRQKVLTNEEGEEHLRQRKHQLPFNLATGEAVLYNSSVPGPLGSGVPLSGESTTEKSLNPTSLLGSLLQQDPSVYAQWQEPISYQTEDLDLEEPQPCLDQDSLDSRALLSVLGHMQTAIEDLRSEASTGSLEQILGDIRDGGLEGLEETELVRMNKEIKPTPTELNPLLANDVFLYAEEALRSELGGFIQGPDQTGPHVSGKLYSLFIEGQNPELSDHEPKSDRTSNRRGFAEQIHLENILGNLAELKDVCESAAPTGTPARRRYTQQGHASSSCPLSCGPHRCGNQVISKQPHVTGQSWLPSMHSSHQCVLEETEAGSPRLQLPSLWKQQQQQLPHCHSLTAAGVNSTPQSFHPLIQQLPGGGVCEDGGHMPNVAAAPGTQTDPLLGPARSTETMYVPGHPPCLTLSHPGEDVARVHQLPEPDTHTAAGADVGNISLGHLNGGSCAVGSAPSDYGPENGSLQSSLFSRDSGAQIPLK